MTTNIIHPFVSAKADGADATVVRPVNWNAVHNMFLSMTNRSGAAVVQYDACAVGTVNDDSFTTTTTQYDTRPLVVVQPAAGIANAVAGNVQNLFQTVVNVQGNVTRGNWLRFSATAGRLEDTTVAGTSAAPHGANAIAVTGYAGGGAGTVTATLLGFTASILPGGTTGTSGGIPYFNATTTVASSALLTANGLLRGGGAGAAPVALAAATNGQIPIGSTGAAPVVAAITAGTGIAVTNGAGSITVGVGVAGTLADVTASRALNTSYQNASSTQYLHVLAVITHSGTDTTFQAGSATAPTGEVSYFQGTGAGSMRATHSVLVPPLWYYRVQGTNIRNWWEMTV